MRPTETPLNLPAKEAEVAHQSEIEAWHKDRIDRLTQPDSWLTLTGLSWLSNGKSSCGSDPESTVLLPDSVPAKVGAMTLNNGKVTFQAASEDLVSNLGQPVTEIALEDDAGGMPTILEIGTVTFFVIRRGDRFGVRVKDSASPVLTGFQGIETFPVSPQWRLTARFEAHDPPRFLSIPNVLGTLDEMESPGAVVFEAAGKEYRIDALLGAHETQLFLVFGDLTNGEETYGGGRFVNADVDADNRVVLDFNKSYNPPCSFTPYATCPMPTPQNRLPFKIRAGEKSYGGGHH